MAEFSADRLTTDGGSPLLRQVDRRIGLLRRFAQCFLDHRDSSRIEHSVADPGRAARLWVGAGL